ncbi:hypothetical protein RUM44_001479 [Polyplax serrata]|uniref:Uncharacterized protein n=1 Tax=Polyplax serrata TaxID=468196 RepID=A0ABR1AK49_POLSC
MALIEEYYELNEADENVRLLDEKLPTEINWENDSWCDYCQYSMVSSFIVATIWATFFLMCGKGGRALTGLPQPWRIVWPSLIFNFIYFIVSLSTAINIQKGTELFCTNQSVSLSTGKTVLDNCPALSILKVHDIHGTSFQLEIVSKTSWGCVLSWLVLFLISFARIIFVIDFNMYKICVFKIGEIVHNKREEVLRVTNYEEVRKIHFDGSTRAPSFQMLDKRGIGKQKGKGNKRLISIKPNTAFYVTTDIRLINREKHRKKCFKLLDSGYETNKTNAAWNKQINRTAFDNSRISTSYLHTPSDVSVTFEDHLNDSNTSSSTTPISFSNRRRIENVYNDDSEDDDFKAYYGTHKKHR